MREFLKRWVPRSWREATYPARERLGRVPGHAAADLRRWWCVNLRREPLTDLTVFEKRYSSQNGEDGILEAIFAAIGEGGRWYVEFGVEDGRACNAARLRDRGWDGLMMDPRDPPGPGVRREFVTAENVEALFDKYGVPAEPDLMSIDVDGVDWWIWKAVARRPRVVVIEYNATIPPDRAVTVAYDPAFRWDGTDYFGASLLALERLGRRKGYRLVACDGRGVNAFFVREDLAEGRFAPGPVAALYRSSPSLHGAFPRSTGRAWTEVP